MGCFDGDGVALLEQVLDRFDKVSYLCLGAASAVKGSDGHKGAESTRRSELRWDVQAKRVGLFARRRQMNDYCWWRILSRFRYLGSLETLKKVQGSFTGVFVLGRRGSNKDERHRSTALWKHPRDWGFERSFIICHIFCRGPENRALRRRVETRKRKEHDGRRTRGLVGAGAAKGRTAVR